MEKTRDSDGYPNNTLYIVLGLQRVISEVELRDITVSDIVRESVISAYERKLKEVKKRKLDKSKGCNKLCL